MIVSLGQGCLQLALACSLVCLFIRHARLIQAVAVLIVLSFISLTYAFITNDFSVIYVANNSNSTLPLIYRICAVWGAHEGSVLLWCLILAGWMFVAVTWGGLEKTFKKRVITVFAFITIGFLAFILFTSNPFDQFPHFFPTEGADLNPLLQDPGMIIHPPILYMGYVGFTVPFAFAIAALWSGQADAAWAKQLRPWVWTAWAFLTVGIVLGSWWAYYELGWGGWWFWDPVENASFMPWLVGTALLHSIIVTTKQNTFAKWTVFLAIAAFSLSLLGTFLVRSGVLTSVHAFATDPARGLFILIFLTLVIGCALVLYAIRGGQIQGSIGFHFISREALMLYGSALLLAAAGTVLLGTLYPLFVDAFWQDKISVGPPYFNTVFVPMMVPIFLMMVLVPAVSWGGRQSSKWVQVISMMLVSGLIPIGLAVYYQKLGLLFLALSIWITISTIKYGIDKYLTKQWNRRTLSMLIAHVGMAVTITGIVVTTQFDIEQDVAMSVGDVTEIGGYRFRMTALQAVEGPNYKGMKGVFKVQQVKGDQAVIWLMPEKRFFIPREIPMSEAAIDPGLFRDLFIALGEPLNQGQWSVRIYVKPFIRWIWLGGLLMALGAGIGIRS